MVRGLRVTLQGAKGPVSLDLFQTTIPDLMGDDHCLLAFKEDPEQKVPDAPPGCATWRRSNRKMRCVCDRYMYIYVYVYVKVYVLYRCVYM